MDRKLYAAALNSLVDPFVLSNLQHTIIYMNDAGARNYEKWGGHELVGKSLMECHNEESQAIIRDIAGQMLDGLQEGLISDNGSRRIYMRAVRDENGVLIGYYERYEYSSFRTDP